MLDRLKNLISELMGETDDTRMFDENDHRLAAAALLVHAVAVDGFIEDEEREKVSEILQRHFELNREETKELIREATEKDNEAVDLYGFTSIIKRAFDQEGRLTMVEMLWEIVYADGVVHEFEDNLVWRVAELLGVSTRDRMHLKSKVREAHE
ncbi:MAG: TerB family tellurite resistance protein [Fimbriimonadaceae bacterium]|nr:TerB family tellurite resistance protein [Alphaproteobacteria bacterium]